MMKKFKFRTLAVLITSLLFLTLVGCGSSGKSTAALLSDADSVAADKASLVETSIKGTNTDLNNVIGNLTLPAEGLNGTAITWTSLPAGVIAGDGTVTRPSYASVDATITLTASILKGVETDTKSFTVIVLKTPYSDYDAVANDKASLAIIYVTGDSAASVTDDVTLPLTGSSSTSIAWAVTTGTAITSSGIVTRPAGANEDVTLTATITRGTAVDTKQFALIVLKAEAVTFTVTFDSQGGSAIVPLTQTVASGAKATAPTDPTKSGNTFGGWYREAECTTEWIFASDTVSADRTLFAKWAVVSMSGTYVVGTYFDYSESINYAAVWKDGVRTNLTENYQPTGAYVTDSHVYIIGYYGLESVYPFYWKDNILTDLSDTYIGQTSGVVGDSDGVIYISGWMENIDGDYTPGYWKDGTWVELDQTTDVWYNGKASCIAVDSTYVYVGGGMYEWENSNIYVGTIWIYNKSTGAKVAVLTTVNPSTEADLGSQVSSIFVKNGIVYAAGNKGIADDEEFYPTYWVCTNTTSWNISENLMNEGVNQDEITSIVVDADDNIIIGGSHFNSDDDSDLPLIWRSNNNGGSGGWDSPFIETTHGGINGLYLSGGDLYAGGTYNGESGNSVAFSAKGTTVTELISTDPDDYTEGRGIFVKP